MATGSVAGRPAPPRKIGNEERRKEIRAPPSQPPGGFLYTSVNTTNPHQAPFFRTLSLVALVAAGILPGCDAPDDASDRALELEDEDLTDEEIDALAMEDAEASDEADEAPEEVPVVSETVADVLAQLPESMRVEGLSAEELGRPVEVSAVTMAVDSNHDGQIDASDDLVAATDPVAIGEMACATQALTDPVDGAVVAKTNAPNCGYAYDSSTSPNGSYDTAACPHQYVTEVTGTSGTAMSAFWDWHGGSLNESNCDLAHASLTFYGATWNWITGTSWTKIGSTSVHGVWVDGPLFDYCSWQYDAGKGPIPSLGAGHGYYKVRTAAQATGFIVKVPVEGGVWHGNGPC